MAASLGTLTLNLVTQIGQFIAPLDQAEEVATEATDNIAEGFNMAGVAATAFGALLAGASVAGVYEYVTGIMEAADQLSAFAKLANASTSQFQYYSKGAESAGIGVEQFADQMKDMQDRIGDFQQSGGGPLADFFENIAPLVGVTIQQFQKLSGPEALQLFYDSLEKVGATKNDMKFYMEGLIGDSSKLIPLLENGGEGFKKWGDNALAAGSIMGDDVVESLADANENLALMMEYWTGLKIQLAEHVAPAITYVVENIDTIKAVALALGAAIATRLIVQLGILSVEFIKGVVEGVRYQMTLAAMAGQTITLTSATTALRTSMWALIGGPAGLAVLAVQALAAGAAFMYMKGSSDDAKTALIDQVENINELIQKYVKLNDEQRQFESSKLREKIEEEAHAVQLAENQYVALAMAKEGLWTLDKIEAYNKMVQDITKNGVSTNDAFKAIKSTGLFSQDDLDKISQLNIGYGDVNTKLKTHQDLLKTLQSKNAEVAQSHNLITTSVNAQAQAYLSLTQKQREALNTIKGGIERENYINANINAGWSREKTEYYADYRDQAGLGYTGKPLSDFEKKTVEQGYKLQLSTEAREASEKKIEEAQKKQADLQKKQTEEAAKKYKYSEKELVMLQKVASIATQNNFNEIGNKYGIPENVLAAVMAQESKGDLYAESPEGAIGPFQTTGIYREQYKMSVKDSYDPKKSAEIAAKDLAASYKVFGNWTDAITAYNAGVRGTQSLLKNGFTKSAAKTKEAKAYAGLVDKWFVGLNGSDQKASGFYNEAPEKTLQGYQEFLDKSEQLKAESLARQVAVVQKYATDEQQIHFSNVEAIKEIEEAYTVDDVNRQKYLDFQKIVYQNDLQEFKKVQVQKQYEAINSLKAIQEQIKNIGADSYDIFAKATMSPTDYQTWGLKNNRDNAKQRLRDQLTSTEQNIKTSDVYTNDDDRYQALLDAHEEYLFAKNALDIQYGEQVKDLAQSQHDMQMGIWQDLLSRTGTIFNDMAEMVKNTSGESSAAYKTMFLVNQGISIAQAMINTEVAATKAMAEGGMVAGIPMAGAIRALGYASVGMIAAQTITGMAHNGIDNIPKEGTWLLDGGERVLNPQQNKDLTNYLSNKGSGGGSKVTINNYGSDKVETSTNSDGDLLITIGKLVKGMVKNETDQRFKQALRQGGELYGLR